MYDQVRGVYLSRRNMVIRHMLSHHFQGMPGYAQPRDLLRRNSGAKGTEDAEDDTETVKPNVGTGPEDL